MKNQAIKMSKLTYNEIHEDILRPLKPARPIYYAIVLLLACGAGWGILAWTYQTRMGLGVTGLHVPICWSPYITNFVFWIGIGHAGTLISAILFLVRSRWRTAIARSSEAMTVFAVLTAAMFPLMRFPKSFLRAVWLCVHPIVRCCHPPF